MNQKLSIYSTVGKGSLEERLRAIRDVEFDAVCLTFEADYSETEGSWRHQLSLADKYGLPVENVHLTGDGMTAVWSDSIDGEFVTKRLIEEIRELRAVGVDCGVCHVTWGYDIPHTPDRIGLDRYLAVAEAAEKYNIKLALENSVFPEHLEFLLKNIDSKNIGFCYDSGHENAFAPDYDYLSKFGDRLFAMHLHDNSGVEDEHAVPFCGTINWAEKVEKLKKTKLWQSSLTLECVIREDKSLLEELEYIYGAAVKLGQM